MSTSEKESILVRDRSGRRRFIRRGAAFVAFGSGVASGIVATQPAFADDCDRNAGSEKNAEAPGSDSDTGAGADPSGCGRRDPPKISQRSTTVDDAFTATVKKIKA